MSYKNIAHDRYNDGSDISCRAVATITGKTFVAYSGDLKDGLISVATATAGEPVAGVAKYDAKAGNNVGVARGSARVITITAGADLTAGTKIQVGESGKAVPAVDGDIVGFAVAPAAADTDALISLAY